MASRALTPTLIVCLAGAVAGGIALARPASAPAPATLVAPAEAPATGGPATTTPSHSGAHKSPTTAPARRGSEGPAKSAGAAPVITVSGFSFGSPVTVAPGAKVTVRNVDSAPHTVTAAGGAFDTRTIAPGATGSFVAPSKPGTYRFACGIHPSMSGSLVVAG